MGEFMDESSLKSVLSDLPFYWFSPNAWLDRSGAESVLKFMLNRWKRKKGWKTMSNYYCRCWYWHHKINFSFAQKLHFILLSYLLPECGQSTRSYALWTVPSRVTQSMVVGWNMNSFFARNDVWVSVPKNSQKEAKCRFTRHKTWALHKCIDSVC